MVTPAPAVLWAPSPAERLELLTMAGRYLERVDGLALHAVSADPVSVARLFAGGWHVLTVAGMPLDRLRVHLIDDPPPPAAGARRPRWRRW